MFPLILRAILIKRLREFSGDLLCVAAFDLVPLEHVDELSILQQCD